jgi:hypothetical protein
MKDLAVGDVVRVVTPDGRVQWSNTCGWLHREPEQMGKYLRLTTSRRQLYISACHLVAVVKNGTVSYVQAGEVEVGTPLLECDLESATPGVWANAVTSIEMMQCQGIYAPLTEAGTVVVDGVAASCYAATHSHKAAHAAMKPMRAMYRHNPEKRVAHSTANRPGQHVQGAHRYVDLLARVAGKA